MTNLADNDKFRDVPFEVHLTDGDPVSMVGSAGGPDSSHIGKPIWHHHGGGHTMKNLRNALAK
jgi:hypothetical protein